MEYTENERMFCDLILKGETRGVAAKKSGLVPEDLDTQKAYRIATRILQKKKIVQYMSDNRHNLELIEDPVKKQQALISHLYEIAMGRATQHMVGVTKKGEFYEYDAQVPFREQITAAALYLKEQEKAKDSKNIELSPTEYTDVIEQKVGAFLDKYNTAQISLNVPKSVERRISSMALETALDAEIEERTETESE